MSKILASIADAETYGRRQRDYGFDETATRVEQTATAARAEHAEYVQVLTDLVACFRCDPSMDGSIRPRGIRSYDETAKALTAAHSLLSRVGGGA